MLRTFLLIALFLASNQVLASTEEVILESFTRLNPTYKDYVPISNQVYKKLCGKDYCTRKNVTYASPIEKPFFILNPITFSKDYIAVFGKFSLLSFDEGIFNNLILVYFSKNKNGNYQAIYILKGVLTDRAGIGSYRVSPSTFSSNTSLLRIAYSKKDATNSYTAYYNKKSGEIVIRNVTFETLDGNTREDFSFNLADPSLVDSSGNGSSPNGFGENYITTYSAGLCDPISFQNVFPKGPLLKYIKIKQGDEISLFEKKMRSSSLEAEDAKKQPTKKRCFN